MTSLAAGQVGGRLRRIWSANGPIAAASSGCDLRFTPASRRCQFVAHSDEKALKMRSENRHMDVPALARSASGAA